MSVTPIPKSNDIIKKLKEEFRYPKSRNKNINIEERESIRKDNENKSFDEISKKNSFINIKSIDNLLKRASEIKQDRIDELLSQLSNYYKTRKVIFTDYGDFEIDGSLYSKIVNGLNKLKDIKNVQPNFIEKIFGDIDSSIRKSHIVENFIVGKDNDLEYAFKILIATLAKSKPIQTKTKTDSIDSSNPLGEGGGRIEDKVL